MTDDRKITRGPLETDEDAVPVGRVIHGFWGSFVHWERPIRRKVFETWRDENGRKMGRWTWEYL